MSLWSCGRLIDLMSQMDLALAEEDFLEEDLNKPELIKESKKRSRKKLAVVSGLAAGSIALTGVAVLLCRKRDLFRKAA